MTREWRDRNRDHIKAYNKCYKKEHAKEIVDRARERRNSDAAFHKMISETKMRYKRNNPEKTRARNLIYKSVKNGKINRPDRCEKCYVACVPEGHHNDYKKPLEVNWLCRSCHVEFHRINGDF